MRKKCIVFTKKVRAHIDIHRLHRRVSEKQKKMKTQKMIF